MEDTLIAIWISRKGLPHAPEGPQHNVLDTLLLVGPLSGIGSILEQTYIAYVIDILLVFFVHGSAKLEYLRHHPLRSTCYDEVEPSLLHAQCLPPLCTS